MDQTFLSANASRDAMGSKLFLLWFFFFLGASKDGSQASRGILDKKRDI
jgi:hypothetical protein